MYVCKKILSLRKRLCLLLLFMCNICADFSGSLAALSSQLGTLAKPEKTLKGRSELLSARGVLSSGRKPEPREELLRQIEGGKATLKSTSIESPRKGSDPLANLSAKIATQSLPTQPKGQSEGEDFPEEEWEI